MKQDIKPSTIMLIAGGAVLLISTFLTWFNFLGVSDSAWSTRGFGLTGIMVAVIGLIVAGGTIATTFANVTLPDDIIGFTREQIYCVLGFSAFLITFGLQFSDLSSTGILLGWIASAVIVAGAYIEMQDAGASAAPAAPPSQF